MKRFLLTFLAVLAAIIMALVGIAFIATFNQWSRQKDDLVTRLALNERKYTQSAYDSNDHLDEGALDMAATDVMHTKIGLVNCYENKPCFFSVEERTRIKRWKDEIAAFNGRGQKTTHEPFFVQDFPVSLPASPSLAAPPYPYELREKHLTGNGYARAWFDESGHCFNVVMTISTGSGMLDMNTINFGQANWIGRPKTSIDVPITYRLR